jgi:hypothetical protein
VPEDRPELVQFGDLTPDHFRRHPVWINCHTADYEEVWYGETDEETFRPFLAALPAGPEHGMLLVQADLTLADGTRLEGFVTPASPQDPAISDSILGLIQPQLFLPSGRRESFWGGILRKSADARAAFYRELGRDPGAVFPIQFSAKPGLTGGAASGAIDGFYSMARSLFRKTRTVVDR